MSREPAERLPHELLLASVERALPVEQRSILFAQGARLSDQQAAAEALAAASKHADASVSATR